MKVFARDPSVVSIDSDLATTSGLEAGVAAVDQRRALNVGVAEANMMLIGEAFAALGHQTWISTFCPFYDWKVLRRIAVGHQERLEATDAADGWLSEGHGLDLTMPATAANFEHAPTAQRTWARRRHDFRRLAHVRSSTSRARSRCSRDALDRGGQPRPLRAGDARRPVLYGGDFTFEFGRGYVLRETPGTARYRQQRPRRA